MVLDRKKGEKVVITLEDGRDVTLVFLGRSADKKSARLGVECDRDVEVIRAELLDGGVRDRTRRDGTEGRG